MRIDEIEKEISDLEAGRSHFWSEEGKRSFIERLKRERANTAESLLRIENILRRHVAAGSNVEQRTERTPEWIEL